MNRPAALLVFLAAAPLHAAPPKIPMVPAHVPAPAPPIAGIAPRVTFHGDVERILQARCQTCHHEGDIAPFPLVTYEDVYSRRWLIQEMTSTRQMPPWHVDDKCATFAGNPSLPDEELATIDRWAMTGAPKGDPADAPPPLAFKGDWALGEPDRTLTMAQPFTPALANGDVYRCFVLPNPETASRYVSAVEVRPGSRAMVHHVLLFIDAAGASDALDAADPAPGYTCFGGPGFTPDGALGGWAPGNAPQVLPDGIGIPLAGGSRVVMQVHYSTRAGVTEPDQTTVGIHYATSTVKKRLITLPLWNQSFRIPAGAADHEVTANLPFVPTGIHLLAITPHMHLLGQSMRVWTTLASGAEICLVDIPEWDFHWQRTYTYEKPVAIPFGARVDLVAHYDNSENNPENPNYPPKEVGWGEETQDEMCIAFLSFTLDYETVGIAEP